MSRTTEQTIDLVKELRARTGVSLSVCRRLVEQTDGDLEAAIVALKKQGEIKAADKGGRLATQGKIHTYVHGGGSKVALVEINCETDFAARSPDFQEFCELVGMQIVGMSPTYVSRSDVPEKIRFDQEEVFAVSSKTVGMSPERLDKIVEGKLRKWLSEICLLEQDCAAAPGKTIEQLRTELVTKIGENVTVRRFVRWEVGEGLEKKSENYLEEVAKLTGAKTTFKLECFCGAPSCQVCHP